MTLLLTSRHVADVLVIDVRGRLTIYDDRLGDIVRSSVRAGARRLVLRMTDLSYIDSAGLSQLVIAYRAVTRVGGDMRLLAPSIRARRLLNMTKLDSVFPILEDESSITDASMTKPGG